MKIYIAAPYPEREVAQAMGRLLTNDGHTITARWLHPSHDLDDRGADTDWVRHAIEDFVDVDACDLLVAYNPAPFAEKGSGGRHVELGLAIAWQKLILIVGERTNVFHYMPGVAQINELGSVDQAVDIIGKLYSIRKRQV